ncbi:MAG: hypothetical protein HYT80_06225 [Euryarchaeota archaeon]|nr:hypothetical protein [Euryarchaeota archaeon]
MAVGKTPLDALKAWWGERFSLRQTFGDPKLTHAVLVCEAIADGIEEHAGPADSFDHKLAQKVRQIGASLLHGRAGERGWATDKDIAAIDAASEKTVVTGTQKKGDE